MKISKLTPGHNLRWESSRMMLPEHVRALKKHYREEEQTTEPVRQEQPEEMDRIVQEAIQDRSPVAVSTGSHGKLSGRIIRYEALGRRLVVRTADGRNRSLSLADIIRIEPVNR